MVAVRESGATAMVAIGFRFFARWVMAVKSDVFEAVPELIRKADIDEVDMVFEERQMIADAPLPEHLRASLLAAADNLMATTSSRGKAKR